MIVKFLASCFYGFNVSTPPFRGKVRLSEWIGKIFEGVPVKTYYGIYLECHIGDTTNRSAILGSYGDVVYNAIRRQAQGGVFFDIGSNSGLFALVASKKVGRDGQVYAFEPQKEMFDLLMRNVAYNQADNIIAINEGVSSRDTHAMMSSWNPMHTGLARVDGDGVRKVELGSFDEKFGWIIDRIGSRPVTIKIDVEGAECDVIAGLRPLLLLAQTVSLIIEIDANNLKRFGASAAELYEELDHYGFLPTREAAPRAGHYDEVFVRWDYKCVG